MLDKDRTDWTFEDARDHLEEVVDAALAGVPQALLRNRKVAVVLSAEDYERLLEDRRFHNRAFVEHLLSFPSSPRERTTSSWRSLPPRCATSSSSVPSRHRRPVGDPPARAGASGRRLAAAPRGGGPVHHGHFLGEIERGIARQEGRSTRFAEDLRGWLATVMRRFEGRILDFDAEDARVWGRLSARLGHANPDLMIAATALARDLVVVTRNVADFAPAGIRLVNPFEA